MTESNSKTNHEQSYECDGPIEMPRPTVAPLVLATGAMLVGIGVVFGVVFVIVGAVLLCHGLLSWIGFLGNSTGHIEEELLPSEKRAQTITPRLGQVDRMEQGLPGYRMRLPEKIHPISAGVKGGIVGGMIMPIPAIIYSLINGYGLWYPGNLLAGVVLPGVDHMAMEELQQFHFSLLIVSLLIHLILSVTFGLLYGVLLPALPPIPSQYVWGGLLLPTLWTGVSYLMIQISNPFFASQIHWFWFILSQFVFGMTLATISTQFVEASRIKVALFGGAISGIVMAIPALFWGIATGHGIWFPVNLLAGMVLPRLQDLPLEDLEAFHLQWFLVASTLHAAFCLLIGLLYSLTLPRLHPISGAIAWGALVLPLLWTGTAYGLMGVVNPILQENIDWPWFVVSQFIFGIAAAMVVINTEKVAIPPAGSGNNPVSAN